MRSPASGIRVPACVIAVAAMVVGCASTFQYRAVQRDFMEAARIDNLATADPLSASTAAASFGTIVSDLTPEKIADLDPKLRGNAWVIRGYSQWRAGQYREAIVSADAGGDAASLGPRDKVLLEMLPALAVESEQYDAWVAKQRVLSTADYPPFAAGFREAWEQLGKAANLMDEQTAPSTRYYLAYQRWLLLTNWRLVIASINREQPGDSAREAARCAAEKVVGEKLDVAAAKQRDAIPGWYPLRDLIKAQGGDSNPLPGATPRSCP